MCKDYINIKSFRCLFLSQPYGCVDIIKTDTGANLRFSLGCWKSTHIILKFQKYLGKRGEKRNSRHIQVAATVSRGLFVESIYFCIDRV